MKATGIVRRIDDLGRIVIPKEIRRTLRIREGDPLEIYTEKDGEVIFKNHLAVLLRVDFQRVALADTQGTADLLWDDDPPEVVNASDDAGCFHILLLHIMRSKSHCYCLQTMGNYANGRQGRKRKGACRNLSGRIWCIFQKLKLFYVSGYGIIGYRDRCKI